MNSVLHFSALTTSFLASVFNSAFYALSNSSFCLDLLVLVDLCGFGPVIAEHDPAPSFSDHERSRSYFLLRGRALHRRQRWRHRATSDERPWIHFLSALFP